MQKIALIGLSSCSDGSCCLLLLLAGIWLPTGTRDMFDFVHLALPEEWNNVGEEESFLVTCNRATK